MLQKEICRFAHLRVFILVISENSLERAKYNYKRLVGANKNSLFQIRHEKEEADSADKHPFSELSRTPREQTSASRTCYVYNDSIEDGHRYNTITQPRSCAQTMAPLSGFLSANRDLNVCVHHHFGVKGSYRWIDCSTTDKGIARLLTRVEIRACCCEMK